MTESLLISVTPSKFKSNKRAFYFLLLIIFFIVTFKDIATGYPFNSPFAIRFLDDVLVCFLYAWFFLDIAKSKAQDKITSLYLVLFILFALLHFIQSIALEDPKNIAYYIFFIRDNFWYFPVLHFSLKYLDETQLRKIVYLFFTIQIVAVFFQILYHFSVSGALLWEDRINGTLGANSSHILSYCLVLLIPTFIHNKSKILIALSVLLILLASARSAIMISTVIFFSCYVFCKFDYRKVLIFLLSGVLFIIPVYTFINNNFAATLDPSVLLNQQNAELKEGVGASRLSFLIYSINKINSLEKSLVGYGSGSYSSRTATVLDGEELAILNQNFQFHNEFVAGGSSYNAWVVEHGYIVFSLILFAFIYPALCLKNKWYTLAGFLSVFLGLSVQKLMESYSFGFLFWLVFSYFILVNKNQAKNNAAT